MRSSKYNRSTPILYRRPRIFILFGIQPYEKSRRENALRQRRLFMSRNARLLASYSPSALLVSRLPMPLVRQLPHHRIEQVADQMVVIINLHTKKGRPELDAIPILSSVTRRIFGENESNRSVAVTLDHKGLLLVSRFLRHSPFQPLCPPLFHPEHLHHLITQMIDHLHCNPATLGLVKRAGGVAVQRLPSILVDLRPKGRLEALVGVVRA